MPCNLQLRLSGKFAPHPLLGRQPTVTGIDVVLEPALSFVASQILRQPFLLPVGSVSPFDLRLHLHLK